MSNHMHEMREQVSTVGYGLSGLATAAGAAATEQIEPLEDYVRQKPLKALLIAAGVGALLGLFFHRR